MHLLLMLSNLSKMSHGMKLIINQLVGWLKDQKIV